MKYTARGESRVANIASPHAIFVMRSSPRAVNCVNKTQLFDSTE